MRCCFTGGTRTLSEQKDYYLKLLHCEDPDKVWSLVPPLSSDLSAREHLVKSAILEIHAWIEMLLKAILYEKLSECIWVDTSESDGKQKAEAQNEALRRHINRRMSFGTVYNLLKPCLDSFHEPDLLDIGRIQELRNAVTHGGLRAARYKGRSPFEEADSFAEVFHNGWVVTLHLKEFIAHRITDPRWDRQHMWDAGNDGVTGEQEDSARRAHSSCTT